MVAAALCMAVGAQAQEQANLAFEKQNDNTELKVRFDNLTALLIDEKSTDVFNAFFPQASAKVENSAGDKARLDIMSGLLISEQRNDFPKWN